MAQISIRPLNLSEIIKSDESKLKQIENNLSDLTKQIVNKDIELIESESKKIVKFSQNISAILKKLKNYKKECATATQELNRQINELQLKIQTYEKEIQSKKKDKQFKRLIEDNQTAYLAQWSKRIELANSINVKAFEKVEIDDRKSKANQVFKWIIVTIYGQPEVKFYWPNFKNQIFEKDEGHDFLQRLGKVNPSQAKEQQRVKTIDFIKNFPQISNCGELQTCRYQVQSIKNVAEIYLNCFEISKKIRELQSAMEKSKNQFCQQDEEAMKWRARRGELQDRELISKNYLSALEKIQSRLERKVNGYKQKQTMAKGIVEAMKRNEIIPSLTMTIENDKREYCECSLF